jgi:hypothetical protein
MSLGQKQILKQSHYRAQLWREFMRSYQLVLATAPETFSGYCEAFRARWIRGSE